MESLEEERDRIRRELLSVTNMLAHVLYEVGEPVYVNKGVMKSEALDGKEIFVDEDDENFVFLLINSE